ncbi:hypothetical protein WL01_22505 [Burkholderia ubonensis]|uniref:hypothetical protein n=1 Tax=Burkholderia ubonensis TaxID=101571 RepID=UPI00075428A1|nr:hypothetical protein [Burkholderia ubonensis]KVX10610.1 hypothetical protein WL01_22505 [Burkholderia ubonensis]KWB37633.1 hypothetical protein WL33_14770 [Burkholderia ubonensis]KWC32455.1 hypothetical protein WL50_23850 [Burkholderia ubonensis]
MSAILEMEVTDADLAAMFGMTTRWVRDRAGDGTIARIGRNRYALGDSVQALIAYQTGGDVGEEINKARLRKLNADATRAELELAKERGEVALISEFERAQSARYAVIQRNVLNVAQRAVLQLLHETDETVWKQKLREELTLALKTAAETEPDLTDEADDDANE